MHTDGDIEVFVIKHVHPHIIKQGWDGKTWDGSGDCAQFESRGRDLTIFNPIRAGGEVWQQYGIHGTFNVDEAKAAALEMEKHFPEYFWGVFKLKIAQITTPILLLTK
jgi:hypothetical protein